MTGFPETRGSLVAAMKSGDPGERARGLETLARAYWKPVYTYVCLKAGRPHEDAADLTQEFLAQLVEKGWLVKFDPTNERLRTSLRVLVDGLVANESKAKGRVKRGGRLQNSRSTSTPSGARPRITPQRASCHRRISSNGSGCGTSSRWRASASVRRARETGASFGSRSFRPTTSKRTPPWRGRVTWTSLVDLERPP
jgi:hypothetical protein